MRVTFLPPFPGTEAHQLLSGGPKSQESPRQTKPKKGPKRKVHELRPFFCEFWCFSLGKQARFTLNFCSSMPPGKVHELAVLWFGLLGWLLKIGGFEWGPKLYVEKVYVVFLSPISGECQHPLHSPMTLACLETNVVCGLSCWTCVKAQQSPSVAVIQETTQATKNKHLGGVVYPVLWEAKKPERPRPTS